MHGIWPGWYPAPNGQTALWYWDGHRWLAPAVEHETAEEFEEFIRPHIEKMFVEGAKYGFQMAVDEMRARNPGIWPRSYLAEAVALYRAGNVARAAVAA